MKKWEKWKEQSQITEIIIFKVTEPQPGFKVLYGYKLNYKFI